VVLSAFATAELMRRFYGRLMAGVSTDEALRQAQLEPIRGPLEMTDGDGPPGRLDASNPFHWTAFELNGAWR
jgi:CHAT domain-containing protein